MNNELLIKAVLDTPINDIKMNISTIRGEKVGKSFKIGSNEFELYFLNFFYYKNIEDRDFKAQAVNITFILMHGAMPFYFHINFDHEGVPHSINEILGALENHEALVTMHFRAELFEPILIEKGKFKPFQIKTSENAILFNSFFLNKTINGFSLAKNLSQEKLDDMFALDIKTYLSRMPREVFLEDEVLYLGKKLTKKDSFYRHGGYIANAFTEDIYGISLDIPFGYRDDLTKQLICVETIKDEFISNDTWKFDTLSFDKIIDQLYRRTRKVSEDIKKDAQILA